MTIRMKILYLGKELVTLEGKSEEKSTRFLEDIWEIEHTINTYTGVRCHIEVTENE